MKHFILPVILLSAGTVFSQNDGHIRCGSENHYETHLQNHPEVVQERAELEAYTAQFVESYNPQQKSGSITIPVVFHVNDPTNPQKVTLAQVQSALDILNEDFSATNSDIGNIRPEFASVVADMEIQFCLAQKDPSGQPTTGITYHYNDYNGREPDGYGSAVKSVEYWPENKYLNIWIVNYVEDDGSLYNSGWAYLPDSWVANNNLDGIVYNHQYLGYVGSSQVSGPNSWQAEMARVFTHEVGHWLNLHHTFKNYCNSPGDYVDDTPYVYHHGSNNCDQNATFCSGVTMIQDQNYMDYTPCPSMFSLGQKARVMAALNSSVAGRNNIWSESNLIATGCQSTGGGSGASVEELMILEGASIYPNPASDEVNIDIAFDQSTKVVIILRNAVGQELMRNNEVVKNGESMHISMEGLPDGVYLVELQSENGKATKRLVKR